VGLKEVKRSKSLTSALVTAFIIFMLIFSGPAVAVSITIPTLPSSITQSQDLTLTFQANLDTGERIPISSYNITVYNSTWQQTFLVYPGGSVGPNVTLNSAGSAYNKFGYGYGYQWGYGYGYDLNYYNYTFGYGYGYGYAAPGYETYNVTLNLSAFNLAAGTYNVNITIDTGDASKVYSSTAYSFTIAGVSAPVITPTANTTTVRQNITALAENQTVSSGVINTSQGNLSFSITANASAPPVEITMNVSTVAPSGVSDVSTYAGAIPGLYFTIDVNDTSWFNSISQVQVKFYYSEADIPSGVSESTLRPLRYTSGSWVRLDCSALGGCTATLADGTILYASGVDTTNNYVWANLSRFSNYGIGGVKVVVAVAPSPVGVGGGVSPWLGARSFDITLKNIQDRVETFFYVGKKFFVAPKELAGTLGSMDYMPTMSEFVARLNLVLWKKVETLVGDPYEIASEKALEKFDTASRVIIARGDQEYPHHGVDSMASVAYARAIGAPILLVKPGELPNATEEALSKLGTKEVIIVGGPVAVSEEVAKKLPSPTRIWGRDRYETAVKIAEALMDKAYVSTIVVTDGLNPDIHAVMVAHYYRAPIVYVAGDEVPATTEAFLKKHKPDSVRRVLLIGLSDKAQEAVKKIVS
jgi:hypothetical protein